MFNNKEMWTNPDYADREIQNVIIRKFLASVDNEAITIWAKLIVKDSAYEVVKIAASKFTISTPITGEMSDRYRFSGIYQNKEALVQLFRLNSLDQSDESEGPFTQPDVYRHKESIISLYITAPYEQAQNLLTEIKDSVTKYEVSIVRWWSKSGHGNNYHVREVFLDAPKTILNKVFYPNLAIDPHEYLKRYLESDEAILLMAGDPGTGKTSLLRHLIYDFKIHADIIYDEGALKLDHVFQNWLFDSESTILIVEDADTILTKRETGQNSLMARFLNLSDGLIKLPNKKLVFTTNIKDYKDVDEALIRPGRCYGILHTSSYTYEQAVAVCKFMDWPQPASVREYTIAELANNKLSPVLRKIGLIR